MTTFYHPDLDDDLAFLAVAAKIVFDIEERLQRLAMSEKRDALLAAEREVSRWEERGQAQSLACANVAACTDRRCRRRKLCAARHWIASRLRLAAEQAKWPAHEREAAPLPQVGQKKGRTGVRP